jgi:hypothetical protein
MDDVRRSTRAPCADVSDRLKCNSFHSRRPCAASVYCGIGNSEDSMMGSDEAPPPLSDRNAGITSAMKAW